MDKILDLFLGTPLARRYVAGYVERGLLLVCLWLAKQISEDFARSIESDVGKFAVQATPILVAALFAWIAQKRMKKAEVTIETSRVLPETTPRSLVDLTVQTLIKRRQAPTMEAATSVAIDHVRKL